MLKYENIVSQLSTLSRAFGVEFLGTSGQGRRIRKMQFYQMISNDLLMPRPSLLRTIIFGGWYVAGLENIIDHNAFEVCQLWDFNWYD